MSVPTSREIYQCLRDAALGISAWVVRGQQADGLVEVEIDGWRLTLQLDPEGLAHCASARSPDDRHADLQAWQRYGTNPVNLLSIWELQQIERRVRQLPPTA